ncbi:MAG TPA: hypothetical protein VEE83_02565 [Thermoplasmata archaeon]|nr:hypothetical protein [Thermoplasmata archaeon]
MALLVSELAKDRFGGIDRVGENVSPNRLPHDLLDRATLGAGPLAEELVLQLGQASLNDGHGIVS